MRTETSLITALLAVLTAAPATAQEADEPLIVYDKGLTIGQPQDAASVKLNGRIQGRYTATDPDDGSPLRSEFSLPRLRASAAGHLGTPRLTYKVQLAFEDGIELKDALSDVHVAPNKFIVRLGKFKRPTTRHFLTSSGKLALVERAITDDAFDGGRDIGLAFHNEPKSAQTVTWMVGAFRDTSNRVPLVQRATESATEPEGFEPAVVARLGFNYGAVSGFDEIDWDDGGLRAGVGISAFESIDTGGEGDGRLRTAIDWVVQYEYIDVTGDIHLAVQQPVGDELVYDGWGFHQQVAAVFFGRVAPAMRLAIVDPAGAQQTTEITGGIGYYFLRHRLKLTTDTSWLRPAGGPDEVRGRAQVQVIF